LILCVASAKSRPWRRTAKSADFALLLPKAKAGSAVIRVRASSFNYHDVFTVQGMPGIKVPLPVIIGLDDLELPMRGRTIERLQRAMASTIAWQNADRNDTARR
jgi:hypothetical protein